MKSHFRIPPPQAMEKFSTRISTVYGKASLASSSFLRHVPNMSPQVTPRSLTGGGQRAQGWAKNRRRNFPTEPNMRRRDYQSQKEKCP